MDNSLELKVSLRVNDSMSDLRTQLTQIEGKLRNVKLKATLDIGDSQKIIDQRIDKLSNSVKKLQLTAGLNYADSKVNIEKTVNRLNKGLNVEATLKTKVDNTSLSQTANKVKQTTKQINDNSKLDFDISQFQKKAQLAIQTLQQSKSHKLDNSDVNSFLNSINQISSRTPNARQEMQKLNLQLKEMAINAKRVDTSMATALKGITMWTVASTAFFAPIQGIKSMTQEVLEFDKQMTNIKRVLDEPSYAYADMLEQTMQMSNELGVSVKNTLSVVEQFARQGYSGDELLDLSKTTETLQTLSDLTPEQSVNTLTSALINFNMTAKESVKVGDMLNEVDNNYAVSTLDLSDSIRKASSTSKTFGVDLQHLIGYTTAIGSATRESGSIIGNSLKTIFSRLTTNDSAVDALKSINISIKDIEGNVRPVQDIVDELAGKWGTLTKEQQQNVAVSSAGIFQLSRFTALLNNYSTAVSATTTAENSAGSMQREHVKFMDSYEAKLNRLSNAWSELSLTVGRAFLNDGLTAGIETLNDVAKVATKVIDVVGFLPVIMGTAGMAVGLLSKNARTLATAMVIGTKGMDSAKASALGLATGMNGATVATTVFKTALRGLMIASGIGIAIAGVSWAVEKLVSAYANSKKEQEEFEEMQKKNTDAMTTNREETETLIASYKRLSEERNSGNWNTDKEKEYLKVQQDLGAIFPSLIKYTDATGQAHLKSSSAIDKEVEATLKLAKARKDAEIAKLSDTFNKETKKVDKTKDLRKANDSSALGYQYANIPMDDYNTKIEADNAKLDYKLLQSNQKIAGIISDKYKLFMDETVNYNKNMLKSVDDTIASMDLTKLSDKQLVEFTKKTGTILAEMQSAFDSGSEKKFDGLVGEFEKVAKSMGATDVQLSNLNLSFDDLQKKEISSKATVFDDMTDSADEASNSVDQVNDKLDTLAEKLTGISEDDVKSVYDLFYALDSLNAQIGNVSKTEQESLLTKKNLTAEETTLKQAIEERNSVIQQLDNIYPGYAKNVNGMISLSKQNREAMALEQKANDILLQAVQKARDGQATAEQQKVINQAIATKKRIQNMIEEINALNALNEAYKQKWSNKDLANTPGAMYASMVEYKEVEKNNKKIHLDQANLAEQRKKLQSLTGKLSTSMKLTTSNISSNSSATNKNTSSKKKNNSETSKSIYLTDKYKQSMDKLNASIQKQENIMKKYPTWSKQYRKALQEQIKLKQKEIDKTNEQYALLKKQIKNGTILQTGTVTVKTKNTKSTTKTSSGTSSSSSLGYTGKYSATIKKYAKQYGVNPNLIAGIIKQESGFNKYATSSAGAKGLMQLMPATAKSLGVKNSYDPSQNIKGGTKLIAQLLKKYGGNVEKALRAYNAGPGNLAKSYGFKETNNYVKKVTSNYSSYLKKATGSVTKVSESAVKNMTTTVKKTTTRKLSGWNGKITSTQSSRINPVTGKREYHNGVDIAGKAGTRIDANIAGKVIASGNAKKNGYSSTYGNIVVIQDSKGNKHLYGHLQKALVKIGQKVDKGQAIAKMGSTGTATGSHLHYTVNQGKSNAMSYVKKSRGNVKITSTGSASTKGVATSKKQAIDEAKATLLELDQLIDDKSAEILELRQAIIDSYLESYDRKVDFHEKKKSNRAISKERSVGDSDWYRKAVENDITNTKYEIKYTKQKQAYIKKLMKSKDINPAEKAKLGDQLDEIKQQLNQYTSDLIASRSEYIGSRISEYDYDIELKDRNITKQDNLQGLMSNTSKQYAKSLESQKKSAKEKAKLLQSELNYAVTQSKYLKNGYQEMRKQKEKADEITNQIIENNQKLAEIANNEYLSKLAKNDSKTSDYDYLLSRSQTYADSLLDNDMNKYSEFGNQIAIKRDKIESIRKNNAILTKQMKDKAISDADKETAKAQLEANRLAVVELQADIRNMYKDTADYLIDLYKDIYEKRRDLEIKAIDEERKRYQKLINDKINELQKLNEEEDHKDQKADYQKQIAELEKRIRQYSGDDSRAGKYEKSKAEEELADLKKEYQKFMRDYETNNKIEEWQKDLDNKETELDDATEATNKYFDNIVNNERKFNEIRQKIISGNVDTFKNELAGMDDFITSNMSDIGEAIAQNISDQIKIATSKLGELGEHYGGDGSNDVWDTPGSAPQISDNYSGDSSPSATTGKITTIKKTNVYKTKKVDEKSVVTTIPKGTTLTYSEYASNWYKVTYNNKTGYVHRPDLQKTTTTTTKNNDGSTTKTKEVTQNGQFISKTSTTTEGGLVKTVKEYNADGTVKSTKYGNVKTTANVTYRTKPDKDVKPSGTFKKGTEMQIQAVGDYYAKVLYSGKTYYLDKSKLKAFKTGGFTGDNVPESGALALLHKKELVLNEQQTKHILQTAETLKGLQLPKINMPNIQLPKTTPSEVDQSTTIEINIEKMTGTEQDLNKLADFIEQRQMKRMRKNGYTRKF